MTNCDSGSVLNKIVGKRLSAVNFVEDYLQLRFDGACLSAYTSPVILMPDRQLESADDRYKNALCDLIGKRVISASEELGAFIRIEFECPVVLTISLKEEDRTSSEVAAFQADEGRCWNVW